MKKEFRILSLVLALILSLTVCCSGLAETAEAADEQLGMEIVFAMMQMIPGMEQIDWETFAKEFEEKNKRAQKIESFKERDNNRCGKSRYNA